MTRVIAVLAAFGAMLISTSASAQLELAKQKNCLACHAVDKKLVGPAYKDVAKKYESDRTLPRGSPKRCGRAESACGAKSDAGQPQVNEAESLQLVKWVLSLK